MNNTSATDSTTTTDGAAAASTAAALWYSSQNQYSSEERKGQQIIQNDIQQIQPKTALQVQESKISMQTLKGEGYCDYATKQIEFRDTCR